MMDGAKEVKFYQRAVFQILIQLTLSSPIFEVWSLSLSLSLEVCCRAIFAKILGKTVKHRA